MPKSLSPSASLRSKGGVPGLLGIWMFPYLLAGVGDAAGVLIDGAKSLRTSVTEWPVPQDVYLWLLVMVVLSVIWLVAEFSTVTNRVIVVRSRHRRLDACRRSSAIVVRRVMGLCRYRFYYFGLAWYQ